MGIEIFLPKLNFFIKIPQQGGRYPRQGIISKCHTCGKPIYISLCRLKKNKIFYCSKNCIKSLVSRFCKYCNKEFFVNPAKVKRGGGIFCSYICFNKNQTKEGIIEYICKICGSKFRIAKSAVENKNRTCCSRKCYIKSISGCNNVNWRGGYYQHYGYGFTTMVREVRERDKVCQICGKTDEEEKKDYGHMLHVHHIIPYRKFTCCPYGCLMSKHPEADALIYESNLQTKSDIPEHPNYKENGILLCAKCHTHQHSKIRKQERASLKKLEEIL